MDERTLVAEYQQWLRDEQLPVMSADELALEPFVTPAQRRWLGDFITRWDVAMESGYGFNVGL